MHAGLLKHRVTVTAVPETPDGSGGFTTGTPTTVASRISAFVEPLSGRELERAMQIDPRVSHRVTLRFRADVSVRQQLIFHDPDLGDRTFEITQAVNLKSDRRELQLLCKEAA